MATRKTPAGSGAEITPEQVDAAERARILKMALAAQQAAPPPMTPEAQAFVALFDKFERRPTAEQRAASEHQARLDAIAARNAKHAAEREAYRQTLRKSGYQGWTGGDQ